MHRMSSILNTCFVLKQMMTTTMMFSEILMLKSREERKSAFVRAKTVPTRVIRFQSEVVEVMMFLHYKRYFSTLWAKKRAEKYHTKN